MISRARGSTVLTSFTNSQSRLAEGWVPFSFSNAAALSQFDRSRPLAFQAGTTSIALAKKNRLEGRPGDGEAEYTADKRYMQVCRQYGHKRHPTSWEP